MNNRKSISLVRHFLKSSPHAELTMYKQIFKPTPYKMIAAIPDNAYLNNFLKSVEVYGTPNSQLGKYRQPSMPNILKNRHQGAKTYRFQRKTNSQVDQLEQCIKVLSAPGFPSITSYHQLEQRIVVAQPETIMAAQKKLTYLFKILLNKRDKLPPQSFELEANIYLSEAIIQKFAKNSEFGENHKEWNKLQAMEKLLRAREYKKKGLNKIALTTCQEIFKDEAAAYQTRLEALRILCNQGQVEGDTSQLESLVSLTSQKGEKEYEEYLKLVITRIKNGGEGKVPQK